MIKDKFKKLTTYFANKKIVAKDKGHLHRLIEKEIIKHGLNCNLNHIDLSLIDNISYLFYQSFPGFNGDISEWDVSKVKNMNSMFSKSKFNGEISKWDVSNVENMALMFCESQFNKDISKWNALNLKKIVYMFDDCPAPVPYWAKIYNFQDRVLAIDSYNNKEILEKNINTNYANKSLVKI